LTTIEICLTGTSIHLVNFHFVLLSVENHPLFGRSITLYQLSLESTWFCCCCSVNIMLPVMVYLCTIMMCIAGLWGVTVDRPYMSNVSRQCWVSETQQGNHSAEM